MVPLINFLLGDLNVANFFKVCVFLKLSYTGAGILTNFPFTESP